MPTDRMTKVLLAAIALGLFLNAAVDLFRPPTASASVQFGARTIEVHLPALAPPDGALHEIHLAAHAGQSQGAGGTVEHGHERYQGQSAIPRNRHPVIGEDDPQVRLQVSEALAG